MSATGIKPIETIAELRDRLQHALEIELALMVQYLYVAYFARPPRNSSVGDEDIVNRWSKMLTNLAIGEMFHAAAVANLLIAADGEPDFSGGDFRSIRRILRGKWIENAGAFELSSFSPTTLRRLLQYELEYSPLPQKPKPTDFFAVWTSFFSRTSIPSIGQLYRTISSFLETNHLKADAQTLSAILNEGAVGPRINASERSMGILKLAASKDAPQEWREVVWSLVVQGEAGEERSVEGWDTDEGPDRSHVEVLATLISEMAANRKLVRRIAEKPVLINPTIHPLNDGTKESIIDTPLATELATACSWAFLFVLQLLSAIWRSPTRPPKAARATQAELFKLAGSTMTALFGSLSATLCTIPVKTEDGVITVTGPTFEIPESSSASLPDDWGASVNQLIETVQSINRALDSSIAIAAGRYAAAVLRLQSAKETCNIIEARLESFK